MHQLEKAAEYADHLIETAWRRPEKLVDANNHCTKWKSLQQRLIDLYLEESKKQAHDKKLKCTSHLLGKLVQRDHLNTLVVNLYPDNEGYSLMLRGRNGAHTETMHLPYEEAEMLEYIDAEELPPVLVDLLDKAQANLFYSGCVVVELRDFRRTTGGSCDVKFVLLRPTSHTLLCDLHSMMSDGHRWTVDEQVALESQLLLHTSDPLCLDPNPAVFYASARLNHHRQKLATYSLKRSVKKYSQAAVNKKRKMSLCPAPRHLRLHDFLVKKKDKVMGSPAVNLRVGKSQCVDMWRQRELKLETPETIEVAKFAKNMEHSKLTYRDNTLITVEEHIFEREKNHGKVNFQRLTIKQRLCDEFYLGELYVDNDYKEGSPQGSTCKFPLGTKANVEKYIRQFQEIFTEEGRRQVKITHLLPNQSPVVTYTQTVQPTTPSTTSTGSAQTTTASSTVVAASVKSTPTTASLPTGQPAVAATAVDIATVTRATGPVRLSLSLGTGTTTANLVSPTGVPVTGGQLTNKAGGQLTVNVQQPQQQLTASQRIRQLGLTTASIVRTTTSQTATAAAAQLPTYSQAVAASLAAAASTTQNKAPTPTPTPPPPALTPTPASTPTSRRASAAEPNTTLLSQGSTVAGLLQAGNANIQLSSTPSTPSTPTSHMTENVACAPATITLAPAQQPAVTIANPTAPPNINIASLIGMPQNINLQKLTSLPPGVNITNLQGMSNVQVSLGGVNLQGGLMPLSMITSAANLNNQAGLLVSSLPSVAGASAAATPSISTTPTGTPGVLPSVTSPQPSFVTMVTAIPASSATSTVVTASTTTTGANTVLQPPTGMLSLPISNLSQLMSAAGMRGAAGNRAATPLLFSSIPGQQQLQLVSANVTGALRAPIPSHQAKTNPANTSTTVAALLTPQNLAQHQTLGALSHIPTMRQQGQPQTAATTIPHIMQQLALQRLQLQQQPFQAQQALQLQQQQQQQQQQPQPAKVKSKKRTSSANKS